MSLLISCQISEKLLELFSKKQLRTYARTYGSDSIGPLGLRQERGPKIYRCMDESDSIGLLGFQSGTNKIQTFLRKYILFIVSTPPFFFWEIGKNEENG